MKIMLLPALIIACALTAARQLPPLSIKNEPPKQYTIIVYYCACTGGGDFTVDSGEVIVPEQLRQSYIDERCKRMKLYGTTREGIAKRLASNGYRASDLRSATVAAWDSLFTPPKRSRYSLTSADDDGAVQGAYWRRRYQITGTIVGLDGPYLVFKVHKAVRISDKEY